VDGSFFPRRVRFPKRYSIAISRSRDVSQELLTNPSTTTVRGSFDPRLRPHLGLFDQQSQEIAGNITIEGRVSIIEIVAPSAKAISH